jgi:hypothetical protein
MGLRILLTISGLIAILMGGAAIFIPDTLIASFELGAADMAGRAFARSTGVALAAVGVMNLLALRDGRSPALYAILVANLLVNLANPLVDFMEPFPKGGGFWGSVALHAVFVVAFGYFLVTWNRSSRPATA